VKPDTHEDVEAFARLVRQHQKAVFAAAYGKLRNVHDAEDVTQDVFIEAYRNYHKLKKTDTPGGWLFTATKFRCKDHIRKRARRERREQTYAGTNNPTSNAPREEHMSTERHRAVLHAIGALPEKLRVVVMLKHFAGLSYADIAATTGLSKTTVDGRLRTAKKRMGRTLTQMGIEEGPR
jgi:RNA polymerase sigma-70 factor (ECF subfamily)